MSMTINIARNNILRWIDKETEKQVQERVLWVNEKREYIKVIDVFSKKAMPFTRTIAEIDLALNSNQLFLAPNDPFAFLYSDSDYLEKYKDEIDAAFAIIKDAVVNEPYIYIEEYRGPIVVEIVEMKKVTKRTVYKYLRKWWQRGMTKYALAPDFFECGAPGKEKRCLEEKRGRPSFESLHDDDKKGINIDKNIKRLLEAGYDEFYLSLKKTLVDAHQRTLEKYFNIGFYEKDGDIVPKMPPAETLPTRDQFYYWGAKPHKLTEIIIARKGQLEFDQNHRAIVGNSTQMAFGPGSIFQVDCTRPKLYLVSSFDPMRIIGRPILYIFIDVFSRMIVGMHVSLKAPQWETAVMGLANVLTDKVNFCARYGITISYEEWPNDCIGDEMIGDRGEFISISSDSIPASLPTMLSNTPPHRCDWKGMIERKWGLVEEKVVDGMQGKVENLKPKRGKRDYRLEADTTPADFVASVIRMILFHNNHHNMKWYNRDEFMITENVSKIPVELWKWGIKNRSGHLYHMDPHAAITALLPKVEASITPSGICLDDVYYLSDNPDRNDWLVRARSIRRSTTQVIPDLCTVNHIYVETTVAGRKGIEKWDLAPISDHYRGRFWEEVKDKRDIERLADASHRTNEIQAKAELNAHLDGIKNRAKERYQNAITNKTDKERIADIPDNRRREVVLMADKTKAEQLAESASSENKEHMEVVYEIESVESVLARQRQANFDKLREVRGRMLND